MRRIIGKAAGIIIVFLFILSATFALLTCKNDSTKPNNDEFNYPDSNLSFTNHIYPIFLRDCAVSDCHQTGNPASGLDLETTTPNFIGQRHGLTVFPNDADHSPLYLVLIAPYGGTPRMPLNRMQLPMEKIKAIRTWINEGASINN